MGLSIRTDRSAPNTFPYGISPGSQERWKDFERILAIQERRGPGVGEALLRRVVDAELQAIEQATLAEARGEHPPAERRVWSGFGWTR